MTPGDVALRHNRQFLLVWGGQSISIFGSQVGYIALWWWVLDSTGSAAALASVAIATAITRFVAGPLAGTFIDRVDRRRLMLWMNILNGSLMLGVGAILFAGRLEVWHLYIACTASAAATLIHRAALLASIPTLVSKEQLTRANSLDQIAYSASGIVGPAVAGMLVGFIGSGPTVWIDATTFLVAALSLGLVSFASPRVPSGDGWRTLFRNAASGFRFLLTKRGLLCMVGLVAFLNLILAPTSVLIPVMARDVLQSGSRGLGFLTSALSCGTLLGGAFTWLLKRVNRHGVGMVLGFIVLGATLALFGMSKNLPMAMVFLGAVGFAVAVVNVFESVVVQLHAPDEIRGRAFASINALTESLRPISLACIGGLLMIISAPTVLVGCGAAVVASALAAGMSREMRRL